LVAPTCDPCRNVAARNPGQLPTSRASSEGHGAWFLSWPGREADLVRRLPPQRPGDRGLARQARDGAGAFNIHEERFQLQEVVCGGPELVRFQRRELGSDLTGKVARTASWST